MQTCPGFFLKSLLEICSVKFVDTLHLIPNTFADTTDQGH